MVVSAPAVIYADATMRRVVTQIPAGDDPSAWTTYTYANGMSSMTSGVPATMDYKAAAEASARYAQQSDLMRLHTVACRVAENHPANFGLVPHKVEPISRWGSAASLIERAGIGRGYLNDDAIQPFLALLQDEIVNQEIGWFRPDQDPTVFGAYHIIAAGEIDSHTSWRSAGDPIGWTLRQVAIDGAVDKIGWENTARMADAAARIREEDLEIAMTMQALSDTEKVSKAAAEHNYKQSARAARTTFANPKTQLRPRLVPEIVAAVVRAANLETENGWRQGEANVTGLLTLDDWSITRGMTSFELDGRGNAKPLNACYRTVLKESLGQKKFVELVTEVQAKLTERKLGVAAYDAGRTDRIWVSVNPTLLLKHRAAFGIADSVELMTLTGPVTEPEPEAAN